MQMVEVCVCECRQAVINVYTASALHECVIKGHAWIYTPGIIARPCSHIVPPPPPLPKGWGHLELVWFYQIDHGCYSPINGSNYRWSRV